MKLEMHTLIFCCLVLWKDAQAVINNGNAVKNFINSYNQHRSGDFTIHKVSLTQKGYIQFLRYITEVPTLSDYTFCIWVKSNNLTYSHPLLSYSKDEEERLVRVWISPQGSTISLEILEYPIFKIPIHLVENHWYHICQSWSSYQASWSLYLNGKLKSSGYAPQLRGIKIKGGGDIVVGQEYTDFDKGLSDGIEGDVFGFNFVLSTTTYSSHPDFPLRRHYHDKTERLRLRSPVDYPIRSRPADDIPDVLGYFSVEPNRKPKGITSIFNNMFSFFDRPEVRVHNIKKIQSEYRVVNNIEHLTAKPNGLKLVELGYNCVLGRGAPVSGKDVLVSWTKTPVRVFGGAILKNVRPFCA